VASARIVIGPLEIVSNPKPDSSAAAKDSAVEEDWRLPGRTIRSFGDVRTFIRGRRNLAAAALQKIHNPPLHREHQRVA
jgi:hypothetical protein